MDIENELKYDLETAANRDALLAALPPPLRVIRQENYFFDDSSRSLLARRLALRVRLVEPQGEAPRATVALKGEAEQTGPLARRPELECELDTARAGDIVAGRLDLGGVDLEPVRLALENLDDRRLSPLVSFTNRRTETPIPVSGKTALLEIDETRYLSGGVDFELEIESADPEFLRSADMAVQRLCQKAGVGLRPQPESKFQRALRHAGLALNS
ncbi:MAG TPA: CYTH domain-containing protein [candidate division Zixibacteria bacterium]|nr:CYTH domain-containing protein [candidate division Zixibacteria bacterium]